MNEFQVVMHVHIQHTIAMRKVDVVFVHQIAKESNAINVCRIHSIGNIRKDVNYVIVIITVQLDNRVICIRENVCVEKDLPVVDVINVQLAISIFHDAKDVIAIVMVQSFQIQVN